jgi:hypothetical protein
MTGRSSTMAVGLLLAVGLAGCASGSARQAGSTSSVSPAGPSRSSGPSSSASPAGDPDAQYAHNWDRASDQARRLLSHAVIPPGAKEQADQPASLPGPALGMPDAQTYADVAKFYRVPLPLDAAAAFVHSHPPAGFTEEGSSQGGSNHTVGYAWYGPNGDPAALGQLSMVLASADRTSSYLRVDGGEDFDDPRPIKDSQPGPRLRIEAGEHCPARDYGVVGVRNPGGDLSQQLAPAATAIGGLVCSYSGFNGNRQALLSSRTLTAAEAGRLGRLAHQVELSHSDGLHSCPFDDGTAQVLVLDYPDRPAVDLWLQHRGCSSVSNGQVVGGRGANQAALLDATAS